MEKKRKREETTLPPWEKVYNFGLEENFERESLIGEELLHFCEWISPDQENRDQRNKFFFQFTEFVKKQLGRDYMVFSMIDI
jgi:hypothetical protein